MKTICNCFDWPRAIFKATLIRNKAFVLCINGSTFNRFHLNVFKYSVGMQIRVWQMHVNTSNGRTNNNVRFSLQKKLSSVWYIVAILIKILIFGICSIQQSFYIQHKLLLIEAWAFLLIGLNHSFEYRSLCVSIPWHFADFFPPPHFDQHDIYLIRIIQHCEEEAK